MLPRVAGSPVMSLMPLLPNSSFSTLSVLRHPIASASASTTQDAVSSGGPLLALIGFCVLPFFWSVPEALVTAELATAFPEDSGYVAWVTAAFGPYWGFQEGFWSWCVLAAQLRISWTESSCPSCIRPATPQCGRLPARLNSTRGLVLILGVKTCGQITDV